MLELVGIDLDPLGDHDCTPAAQVFTHRVATLSRRDVTYDHIRAHRSACTLRTLPVKATKGYLGASVSKARVRVHSVTQVPQGETEIVLVARPPYVHRRIYRATNQLFNDPMICRSLGPTLPEVNHCQARVGDYDEGIAGKKYDRLVCDPVQRTVRI
jgi:hypothetical protein